MRYQDFLFTVTTPKKSPDIIYIHLSKFRALNFLKGMFNMKIIHFLRRWGGVGGIKSSWLQTLAREKWASWDLHSPKTHLHGFGNLRYYFQTLKFLFIKPWLEIRTYLPKCLINCSSRGILLTSEKSNIKKYQFLCNRGGKVPSQVFQVYFRKKNENIFKTRKHRNILK